VFYPVDVPGALFSGGDLHFSQGDGEITFCGAIEMGGFIDVRIDLIKGGMETYGVTTNPILMPGSVEPRHSEFVTATAIFDFDIRPTASGPVRVDRGSCAVSS
jgi:formamidase